MRQSTASRCCSCLGQPRTRSRHPVGLLVLWPWSSKASAPGAAIIHFFGGIHEIYFPYVLMRPQLIIAAIGGGATGASSQRRVQHRLVSPAAPGSIIAVFAVAARDSYLGLAVAVFGAAAVSFAIAALLLRFSKKGEDDLAAATAKMEEMKGKKSSVAGALAGGSDTTAHTGRIEQVVFACDAGMGSSAMGATVLRNKMKEAGFTDVRHQQVNREPSRRMGRRGYARS